MKEPLGVPVFTVSDSDRAHGALSSPEHRIFWLFGNVCVVCYPLPARPAFNWGLELHSVFCSW